MSKTFKTCIIFSISTLWLVLTRLIFSLVNLSDNVSDWVFSFAVQVIGMGVIPLLLYKFWIKEDIVTGFSLNTKINPLIYLVAVALGFVVHLLITNVSVLWQNIIILMGFTPINSVSTIYSGPEVLIMDLLVTAMLPAMFEELNYRGLAMQMLSGLKDDKVSLIIMATLFGLGHQFIVQTGYAFAAGLVLAYVALKSRSILPGMIIHFINNAISVFSTYSTQKGGAFAAFETNMFNFMYRSFGTIIVFLAAEIAVTVFLLKLVKKLSGEKPIDTAEEGTYFYPNSMQYIDELFGKPIKSEPKIRNIGVAWYEYAFLYAAIAIMTATTMFTFMWGVWR